MDSRHKSEFRDQSSGIAANREPLALDRPASYGHAFADVYDRWYNNGDVGQGDVETLARFVAERCPSSVVIELGVGSGRLARPLTKRGLTVFGVDASPAMLRRCPDPVLQIVADMAALPLAGSTAHAQGNGPTIESPTIESPTIESPTILCGFNTLFNLHSSERLDQLLLDIRRLDAVFIVEIMNADLFVDAPERSTGRSMLDAGADGIVVSSTAVDRGRQRLIGRHLEIVDGGVVSRPWMLRWIQLSELDDRAADAGFRLTERYSTWSADPFAESSEVAVSVYHPCAPSLQ